MSFTVPKTTCISIPLLSNRKSSLLLNCVGLTFVWDFLKIITKISTTVLSLKHMRKFLVGDAIHGVSGGWEKSVVISQQ